MQNENPLNYLLLEGEGEHVNFREKLDRYLYHWRWFVLSIIIALVLSALYLKITPKQYDVSTTILVEDGKNGESNTELSTFQDLGLLKGAKNSVDNEMGLLKSRSLMESVVKDLTITASYYDLGTLPKKELFQEEIPFKINFFPSENNFYNLDTTFVIKVLSSTNYIIQNGNESLAYKYNFGENLPTKWGSITITPTAKTNFYINKKVEIKIEPLKNVVKNYRKIIKIVLLYKNTGIIEISLKQPNILKARAILNTLVNQYNKNGIENKKLIAENTDKFIGGRLLIIKDNLSTIDKGVEEFKTNNRLNNISIETSSSLKSNTALENKIADLNTQIKLAALVTDYVSKTTEELIPADLGLKNGSISNNSIKYNDLLLERNRILKSSGKKNPVIVNLDEQLAQLRESLRQSLMNLTSSLNIALNAAKQQEYRLNSKIALAPKQEREFNNIQRQQKIISTLYLYLLQKREENAIKLAATVPIAKIIDVAGGSNVPVSPVSKIIYLIGLLVGLIVPFLTFFILFLFDNKVHTSKEIENIIKVPILGDIPKVKLENMIVVNKTSNNAIAESFRMLRTMLTFNLPPDKKDGKSIFITSTIAGEGKTFISINLASVLALSNKKVLLIGADIRKSKIKEYLNIDVGRELKNFLNGGSIDISKGIMHYEEANFDIFDSSVLALNSSVTPLNPSDLLVNGRFEKVLAYGKENYDYVLVDTAPVKMATDAILLGKNADLFLYVVRANYLDKRMLEIPKKLYSEKRLPNMAILINCSKYGKVYSYGYGYGVEDKKSWWKIKSLFSTVFQK